MVHYTSKAPPQCGVVIQGDVLDDLKPGVTTSSTPIPGTTRYFNHITYTGDQRGR